MSKILLIDNFDSFTHNIVHLFEKLGFPVDTVRNNVFLLEDIEYYDKIIISPGPGIPTESPNIIETIQKYHKTKSILGICLGHQAICEAFGGKIKNLSKVYHGVSSEITILDTEHNLFKNISNTIEVARYHSWAIDENHIGTGLKVTSVTEDGTIMSIKHEQYDVQGIQFHPESILTPLGEKMIQNWLEA